MLLGVQRVGRLDSGLAGLRLSFGGFATQGVWWWRVSGSSERRRWRVLVSRAQSVAESRVLLAEARVPASFAPLAEADPELGRAEQLAVIAAECPTQDPGVSDSGSRG